MTDLEIYQPGAVETCQPALAMTPEQAKALDDQVRACTRAVLREGSDYGVIPGTNGDKVLFRPGAQKLLQWFGLGFTCDRVDVEHDDEGRKHGITYRAAVGKRRPDGSLAIITTCEGTADYDETKFYKTAQQVQADAEAKERYWAKKDRRVASPEKWKNLGEYRAPWNTLMKRAQKRAIVGATIDATAAGGLFSQDQEEDDNPVPAGGGPSWYEQALEAALTFTAEADGQRLFVESAHAGRDGLCTPQQATHVRNRIRQRLELLKTATPVDAEDLGRRPAAAEPPLPGGEAITAPVPGDEARAPEGVKAGSSGPGAAGDALSEDQPGSAGKEQLTRLHTILSGLGSEDREERLRVAEALTGRKPLTGPYRGRSSRNLSFLEAQQLIGLLGGFGGDHDNLLAWLAEREQKSGESDG